MSQSRSSRRSSGFFALTLVLLGSLEAFSQAPQGSATAPPPPLPGGTGTAVSKDTTARARFAAWLDQLGATPARLTAAAEVEGIRLAEERGSELYELIRTNPQAAFEARIGYAQKRTLPLSEQAVLEATINPGQSRGNYLWVFFAYSQRRHIVVLRDNSHWLVFNPDAFHHHSSYHHLAVTFYRCVDRRLCDVAISLHQPRIG